ncbi:hypothetical protein CDAR_603191 [Caerostris darwini]|uniref:Uncharacterized protein n=1 Tax=Caerostris darwini TaxID=1538125 RepID=A0AAV4PWM6_9ARAC|nr:hypothetical protein CDAR_603191 [Caerostris darwini]
MQWVNDLLVPLKAIPDGTLLMHGKKWRIFFVFTDLYFPNTKQAKSPMKQNQEYKDDVRKKFEESCSDDRVRTSNITHDIDLANYPSFPNRSETDKDSLRSLYFKESSSILNLDKSSLTQYSLSLYQKEDEPTAVKVDFKVAASSLLD